MTRFYGTCAKCGRGYVADAEIVVGEKTMLGPELVVVCQAHYPVGEARLLSEFAMTEKARAEWEKFTDREAGNGP